ncbi:MAG: PqqD family peptide modification chaperone [Pseudonocardiaceae bacterium]
MADGLTLLDERRGMIYHLNQTGALVLSELLDGGGEATVAALCARYAVTSMAARRDVAQLLDALLAHRLVVVS